MTDNEVTAKREPTPANSSGSGEKRGRFRKGQSGNPSGRPQRDREFHQVLREKYGPRVVRAMVKFMRSKNERIAFMATEYMCNRIYGKPVQALTGPGGAPLVNVTVNTGQPITDASEAARVYAEILGDPSLDLSGITFAAPVLPEVVAEVSRNAAPLPEQLDARIAPIENGKLTQWEALSKW